MYAYLNKMVSNFDRFTQKLERVKTKDFDREEKLKSIKQAIESEFTSFLQTAQPNLLPVSHPEKLKSEYNNLYFKNLCKQKTLSELENRIKLHQSSRRSESLGSLQEISESQRIQEVKSELETIYANLEKEFYETELLQNKIRREGAGLVLII